MENTITYFNELVLESAIMGTNKMFNDYRKISGLTRLLVCLRLKNKRLQQSMQSLRLEKDIKEKELKIYINKFLENEQRWEAINYINKNINSTLTIDAIYKFVDDELGNLLDVDFCAISTYDDICRKYILHCVESPEHEEKAIYLNNFLENNFCLNSDSDVEKDVITSILNSNLKQGFKAIPLINMTRMFGVIFVYKEEEAISEEHFKVLNMAAGNISMALVNASLYSKIELSYRRKLEYIAHLSHEFKTPLNAINGFTMLMYNTEFPREQQVKYHRNILNASKHLSQVAEYSMDMARAETDNLKLRYEKFSPAEVISEVLAILDEKISEKAITLIKRLDDVSVNADKRRFKQLIYNLVGNALKFNKHAGEIEVISKIKGENYYFEVRDTGEGIHPDEQDKIFEFFSHINHGKFENKEGSGIGLSLCRKIVNLHKGEINFRSQLSNGSIFWFVLPVNAAVAEETS